MRDPNMSPKERVAGVVISLLAGVLSLGVIIALADRIPGEGFIYCIFGFFLIGLLVLYSWLSKKR